MNLRMPLSILLFAFLSACSGSAIRHHSYAAQTLDDLAKVAKETVMADREATLRAAGLAAEGRNVEEAVAAAAMAYQKKVDVVNSYIAAKDIYVRAVLAAINKDVDVKTILPILHKGVIAYAGVKALFKDAVPDLPKPVKEMLK